MPQLSPAGSRERSRTAAASTANMRLLGPDSPEIVCTRCHAQTTFPPASPGSRHQLLSVPPEGPTEAAWTQVASTSFSRDAGLGTAQLSRALFT